MMGDDHRADFERFFSENEPRLRRAYVGICSTDGAHDAVAEAFAWAWEHWPQVQTMSNPVGYLYRVGQSKARCRRAAHLAEALVGRTSATPAPTGRPEVPVGTSGRRRARGAERRCTPRVPVV